MARLVADVSAGLGRIEERVPPERAATASLVVAPDLRRILEAAAAAARQSRRRDINGAIVLAAIVGDGRSAAAHLLRAQGLTFEEAIRALQRAQNAGAPRPAAGSTAPPPPAPAAAPAAAPGRPDRAPASADAILASARERVQTRAAPGLADIRAGRAGPDEAAPARPVAPHTAAQPRPEPQPKAASPETAARADGDRRTADQTQRQTAPAAASATPDRATGPAEPARVETPAAVQPPPEPPRPARAPEPQAPTGAVPARQSASDSAGPAPASGGPRHAPPAAAAQPLARQSDLGDLSRAPDQPPPAWTQVPDPAHPAGWTPQRPQDLPMPAEPIVRGAGRMPSPGPRGGYPASLGAGREPSGRPAGRPAAAAPAGARAAPREAPRLDPARDISPEEFARELRAPTSAPAPAPARRRHPGAAVTGQLAENIPRRMRLAVPVLVEVRVGRAEVQALAERLEGGGGAYRHEVVVTKAMSVRLRPADAGFWVETASPETQWIATGLAGMADDFVSWRWSVTPRVRGRRRLHLLVSARTVGADGLAAETALPDQVIEVKVRTNYGASAMRWGGWLVAAVVGGVLARFGEEFYAASAKMAARIMSGG
jgi:hypothetical protein